jgi:hypothetical protein
VLKPPKFHAEYATTARTTSVTIDITRVIRIVVPLKTAFSFQLSALSSQL